MLIMYGSRNILFKCRFLKIINLIITTFNIVYYYIWYCYISYKSKIYIISKNLFVFIEDVW